MINLSKTTLLSILLIFFTIIASFFVYQWWQARGELVKQTELNENLTQQMDKLQKEIEELKVSKEEITEEEEKTIEEGLAKWRTYKNEERGFEIKYRGDWEIEIVDPWRSIDFTKETSFENIGFAIGINLYGEFGAPFVGYTGKEITIEDIKVYPIISSGLKVVYLDMCFDGNLKYLGSYCKEGSGNLYYQFNLGCEGEKWEGREGMDKCEQLFGQIVSTFKFIK